MSVRVFTMFLIIFVYTLNIKSWNLRKKKSQKRENPEGEEEVDATVFCRKRSRLIKLEKSDDFFIVDVVVNSSISMQCKFCEERDNGLPKTWSWQKRIFTGNITEVELNMDNNASLSKIFVTKTHSLVIKNVQESDMGLYFCKAPYVDNLEKSFNYLVDLVSHVQEDVNGGNLTDWKNYSQVYFTPVADKLTALKTDRRDQKSPLMNLTIFTDWSEWSECDACFRSQGVKSRIGRCRLKPVCENPQKCFYQDHDVNYTFFNDKFNTDQSNDTKEVADPTEVKQDIFIFSIALSCQSFLLKSLFLEIYNVTQDIPDFVLSENCIGVCKGRARKKGPKYKRSIILAKGAHLTLICPDSSIDSQVRWEHNKVRLYPNEGLDYVPGTIEPSIYVDSFNTLYLFDVTEKESGNFTCFVNGTRMQEISVAVLTRSLFFTKEFRRHLGYLGLVFLLCFFAYLSGVVIVCIKKRAENRKFKSFKQSEEDTDETEALLN